MHIVTVQEHIPLDAIVQDWFWWKTEGDPFFNSNFPDVPGELKQLHDEHVHSHVIGVGTCLIRRRRISRNSIAKHFDVPNAHVYDSTNPRGARFLLE